AHPPRLLLVETNGRPSEGITELFAALALRGPFYAIAGGEWLPTYALVRALRRRTTAIQQVLGHVRLARPFTCYQVLDLLTDIRPERDPVLVLDFLHHFHNPDIPLDVRQRVLEQCCRRLERLSLSRTMLVFAQCLETEEYRSFFPMVADAADEVLQAADEEKPDAFQLAML
ncbi:MAG TPA: hypothetical protein VIV15_00930, partial [Anaerolineales bacterium]